MNLPFKAGIGRADRDNTIDIYISEDSEDVLKDGAWQQFFTEQPEALSREEKKEWIAKNNKVALGSDAFFPLEITSNVLIRVVLSSLRKLVDR